MEDEEAALKKQLEETSDFDERREIRQKLRDIRKKKLDALQSDTTVSERPRRRERVKREEQTTVVTTTTTSDVNEHDSTRPATVGSKIEVNYSRTVITGGNSENEVENGDIEGGKYKEEISAEDEVIVEDQVSEVSASQFFSEPPVNGESDSTDNDKQQEKPEHELQSNASLPQEPELLNDNESEVTGENNTEEESRGEEEEEVVLTPQVVEKIDDVDQLEKLLKEVPLNEYELRKAIRMQIRQLRVRKESSETTENRLLVSRTKELNTSGDVTELIATEDYRVKHSDASLDKHKQPTYVDTEKSWKVCNDAASGDDALLTVSDEVRQSASGSDSPGRRPLQPAVGQITSSESELSGDFKSRILGQSAALPRDLAKKGRPSGPEQVDFRGHLKRTGLRTDKDLNAQGKKREQLWGGKYQGHLKTSDSDTSKNLQATRNVGRKTDQLAQVDFRGVLTKRSSDDSLGTKNISTRPSKTYLSKRAEIGTSRPDSSSKAATDTTASQTVEVAKKEGRRISSSDLLNLLHKPVETSKESFLVQRGIKKAETQKPSSVQKFIAPSVCSTKEDDSFRARMAERKERSDKIFLPPSTQRKKQSDEETRKDFRNALKPTGAGQTGRSRFLSKEREQDAAQEQSSRENTTTTVTTFGDKPKVAGPRIALPSGTTKWNERYSVDIQNKDELHKLRAELLKQREEKDKDSVGCELSVVESEKQDKEGGKEEVVTTVEENTTVEPEGEGTKEVTTRTEKTTEVEETDAGKAEVTTEVKKTTEVHKTGGATMTVTKTTRTTEVKRPGGIKGSSIDAMFAQRQKERMMAKKQQEADTKNKRMAFKQQLESQAPKVEGGKRFQTGNTAVNQLQEWCRRRTRYHEGVDIQNFTTSWANGLAMCALLNYFLPEKIPFDTLDPKNKRANWELAFNVAGEEGIEPLLELEDVMAVDVPEPKSLITYVHFIYQHFAEKQQNQKQ